MTRQGAIGASLALTCVLMALAAAGSAGAGPLAGAVLVRALQRGGYVLVMRHASSPPAPPGAGDADPGNRRRERQLDAKGRRDAEAMGAAIRALRIPVGVVWSSPTYRALQTARLAGLPTPRVAAELGDRGKSMQAATERQAAWLRAAAAARPRARTDTIIVTQYPNIQAAFGRAADGMGDGEALVFRPDGGAPILAARIAIERWPALAANEHGHAH